MEFPWETFGHKTSNRTGSGYRMQTTQVLKGGTLNCSFCSGKGILRGTSGTKCPTCKGSGKVCITGPVIKCSYCNGRGEYPARTNLSCPVCKGTGFVSIIEPIEVCDDCHGSGANTNNSLPCLKCRGKGMVTKKK